MQLIVNIVVLAAIYALIACGYVLIYRVSRVLNLAHGELMMLGAYLLLTTASAFSGNAFVAIAVAIVLSLLVGVLIYVFLMRKMAGEMVLAAVLTTVALGILLRGLMILIWSAQQQYPGQALALANPALVLPGGGRISLFAALIVVAAALSYGGAVSVPAVRALGRAHARGRAESAARRPARHQPARGLRPCLGTSTLTGSLAGMLIALDSGLTSSMAVIGLKAFPAALVGGLDSLLGALLGALIVGAAEVLSIQYIDPLLSDVVPSWC